MQGRWQIEAGLSTPGSLEEMVCFSALLSGGDNISLRVAASACHPTISTKGEF
jgi:hypothetical protein